MNDITHPESGINWGLLGSDVRDRFDGSITHLTFHCPQVRTDGTASGCYIIRFMRFLGTSFPAPGEHRAAHIHVDVMRPGRRSWRRSYLEGSNLRIRLDTVKREIGDLIEERSGLLAIVLRPHISEHGLKLVSEKFNLAIGPYRFPLPQMLTPGQLVVEHRHNGEGKFIFDMRLVNTRFGELFIHRGEFEDIRVYNTD